jgi:AraC-like DNA-binding protein
MNKNKYVRTDDFLIERVKRDANYNSQPFHFHPYYEIGFLVKGSRNMTINHSIYNLKKGNAVFISTGELHKGYPVEKNPGPIEWVNIYFTEKYIEPFYEIFDKAAMMGIFSNHIIDIPLGRREYLEEILQKMTDEYAGVDELSKKMLDNYFNELIIFLIRCQKNSGGNILEYDENNKIIADAAEYIYFNYDKNITLDEVTTKFNMSKSYFSKRFKEVTGFGYKEYLVSVRLKEACELLLNTDESITEIAFECGFNDSNYFGDAFRKAKGVSPHKYRKNKGLI